ncbi:hypothetical protein B0H66DRAFT_68469 [Apodospora peruviana]|uniref:Uncharacterized protein n=1 Tax=Apodospora peruviana TaxID=516989 RepID=A0AAE0ITB7_9PEZI|nr:hypothetical protein B0H66DRAFT_68469 [Apodospora peruviana]
MGSKRDYTALLGEDGGDEESPSEQPSGKRRRENKNTEPQTDVTYGQRSAFPVSPVELSDDDLEWEDVGDALSYLKSVRQEAGDIPHLLTAPKAGPQLPLHLAAAADSIDRSIYESGIGDSRGYYKDGAYIAAPDVEPSVSSGSYDSSDAGYLIEEQIREDFYDSFASQFLALRAIVHREPPLELVAALPEDHGTHVGQFGPRSSASAIWTQRMRSTDPLPVQIAAMDRHSVLRLLRLVIRANLFKCGFELTERTSRWLWALLARLPDKGEMDHLEISWIRDLCKEAQAILLKAAKVMRKKEREDIAALDKVNDARSYDVEANNAEIYSVETDSVEINGVQANGNRDKEDTSRDVDMTEEGGVPEQSPVLDKLTDPSGNPQPATGIRGETENDGEMDMDLEDGEVSDDSPTPKDTEADIAAAKARLLAQLEHNTTNDVESHPNQQRPQQPIDDDDKTRFLLNANATLTMILTVAGEFFGQRDLMLKYRNPFPTPEFLQAFEVVLACK